jgi:hypothetical protein
MVINDKKNEIEIKCQGADTLPIDLILEFQGGLKKLSSSNRDKLMKSILSEGFIAPLFVWDDAGDYRLLDGHQRIATLVYMREQGWNIPLLPVVHVQADSEADAKRKLLQITSQFGEFDMSELQSWIDELGDGIEDTIRLVDQEIEGLVFNDENYTDGFTLPDGEKEPFQQMSFILSNEQAEKIKKEIEAIKKTEEFELIESFGNENSNGNALYGIVLGKS